MSTYYYLLCDDHKQRTDACSKTAGGIGNSDLCDSDKTLKPFIVSHCGCKLRSTSEHDETAYDYAEWDLDTISQILKSEDNDPDKLKFNGINSLEYWAIQKEHRESMGG